MPNRPKSILGGAGFYTILFLCLAVVGTSAWFLLFRGGDNSAAATKSAQTEVTATAPEIKEPDTQAASSAKIPADTSVKMPEETVDTTDNTPVAAEAPNLIVSPLSGNIVAAFSEDQLEYNDTLGDWRTHDGIDIAAALGTKVLAACAGTVSSVSDDDLLGTTVVISHADGYQSTYANLQAKPTVNKGDTVSAGQVIGAVGETSIAESAEGPHLHFSVSKNGKTVDPEKFLKQN